MRARACVRVHIVVVVVVVSVCVCLRVHVSVHVRAHVRVLCICRVPPVAHGELRKGPPFRGSQSCRDIIIQNSGCQKGDCEVAGTTTPDKEWSRTYRDKPASLSSKELFNK